MTCRIHQLVSYSFYYVAIYRVLLILHYIIHKELEEEECTMSTDNDGNLGHCNNDVSMIGVTNDEFIDNGDDDDDDDDVCSDGENFIFLRWILMVFFQNTRLFSH